MRKDVAIVGAGFYGLMLGIFLADRYNVTIFEEENDVMTKASSLCQMRIHTGMMYPTNLQTALSCIKTFKPFMVRFKSAIVDNFTSLYAIASDSKVSCEEFLTVQKSLGQKFKRIDNTIFSNRVTDVFKCEEFTFDPVIIKSILLKECSEKNVKIEFNHKVNDVFELSNFDKIFLCNYAEINSLLRNSGLTPIENVSSFATEKIFYRDNLDNVAVCVIDGNYFSTMCLPERFNGLKTVTGADITNNISIDSNGKYISGYQRLFARMREFIPNIELEYDHSEFGLKSVNKNSNCRTCMVRKESFDLNIYSIMGGKITNVFSMFDQLKNLEKF